MVRIENSTLVPGPEGRARRRTPQPVTGKLSLPNPAKPIPISHAHSYGINRAYLTAKDGSSRSRSRADHECTPRRRGPLQTKTASPERNGSKRSLSGRTIAARAAHPGYLTGRAHTQRGGRNARQPPAADDAGDPGVAIRAHATKRSNAFSGRPDAASCSYGPCHLQRAASSNVVIAS